MIIGINHVYAFGRIFDTTVQLNSHVRKVLHRGTGIDIGVLRSTTIMNEPNLVRAWSGESPQYANDCELY